MSVKKLLKTPNKRFIFTIMYNMVASTFSKTEKNKSVKTFPFYESENEITALKNGRKCTEEKCAYKLLHFRL